MSCSLILVPVPIPDFAKPAPPNCCHSLASQRQSLPTISPPVTPIDKLVSAVTLQRRANNQMWRDVVLPSLKSTPSRRSQQETSQPAQVDKEHCLAPNGSSSAWRPPFRSQSNVPSRDVQGSLIATHDKVPFGDAPERIQKSPVPKLLVSRPTPLGRIDEENVTSGTARGDESPAEADAALHEPIQEWPMPSGVWADDYGDDDVVSDVWRRVFSNEIRNLELRSIVKNWPAATGYWASSLRYDESISWPEDWCDPVTAAALLEREDGVEFRSMPEGQPKSSGRKGKKRKRKNNRWRGSRRG